MTIKLLDQCGIRGDSIARLHVLNRGSRQHAFGVDELDWSRTVDRSKPWMPDRCSPMCFLPAYAELDEPQQRRLNQLSALRACEQFIWLERHVVITPALAVLKQRGLPQALREALWHFVEEEDKHIAMFWLKVVRMLNLAKIDASRRSII